MEIIDDGHRYLLKNNGKNSNIPLTFFKDEKIHEYGYDGTTIQEVLRACINRIKYFDRNCPDDTLKKTEELLIFQEALILVHLH